MDPLAPRGVEIGPKVGKGVVSLRALVACVLLGSTVATPALADSYDSSVARAAAARDRALETDNPRDWEEALELFAASVDFKPTMEAKFELAEAALHLHLDDEAYEAYSDALELGLSGKAQERAQAFLQEHEHQFGRLALSGPAGARVYLDNRKRGVLPLTRPLTVSSGVRRLHVDATDFQPLEQELTIASDQTTSLAVTLEVERGTMPPAAAATPRRASRPEAGPVDRGWALPVLLTGGGLTLASGVTIIATSISLQSKRRLLRNECAFLRPGQDECAATTASHASAARSLGDEIATLNAVRVVAVGAAVLGAGAVGISLFKSVLSEQAPLKSTVRLEVSGGSVGAAWQSEF
jgi:hypothetical protein